MENKIKKAIENLDGIEKELFEKSLTKLEKLSIPALDGYMPNQIITLAKSFCQIEVDNSIEAKQEQALKDETDFILKTRPSFEELTKTIFDLVSSEIGDSPTKSYSVSVDTNQGSVIAGLTAYQANTPERAKRTTYKQEIQAYLKALIETYGLRKLESILKVKRGTKPKFTFGVFSDKVKILGDGETPDLDFQLTLGYNSKLPENVQKQQDADYIPPTLTVRQSDLDSVLEPVKK